MGLGCRGKEKPRGVISRKKKKVILIALEGNNKTESLYFRKRQTTRT